MTPRLPLLLAIVALLGLPGCGEDARRTEVRALTGVEPRPDDPAIVLESNAYDISEGKRLYTWYNCGGCHSSGGGGGMGPALLDGEWKYGASPEDIHNTIVNGRPDGMPAFGTRMPDAQVWQLVAYVRSMSGLVFTGNATGRSDAMQHRTPEARSERAPAPWRQAVGQ
jgi:cytochrome c oxidase cbb3-type subunit 3